MKNAYPNFAPDSIFIKPVYNLNKWLEAMREIYSKLHFGVPFKESFGSVTSGWDIIEMKDFSTWLSYYQAGNQAKYKKAQFYVNDSIPGYLIPNIVQQRQIPSPIIPDANQVEDTARSVATAEQQAKLEKENKRILMEDQRKKIIGRLQAAIKHLTAYEGHLLAGEEFNQLLHSMYEILKQIQTVNKISISNQLYYDLIVRQSNKLSHNGYLRSARFLNKFAQNMPSKLDQAQGPTPIASQTGNGIVGSLENPTPPIDALTAPIPSALEDPPTEEPPKEEDPLDEVMKNLNTGNLTDENFSYDNNELDDEVTLDDDLSVEAQMAPPLPETAPAAFPAPPLPSKPPAPGTIPEDMEVSLPEENQDASTKEEPDKDIDAIINSALSSISIKDVVKKIEDVNAIFQNRTIARELSIIDLMLSNLGLSSYFNNLSEIIQKNHEASNYSISRLSDILTKLRGAISADAIDLTEQSQTRPDMQQVQNKLQDNKDKEESRREMRKQIQDNALSEELQDQNMEKNLPEQQVPQTPSIPPGEEVSKIPTQLVP